MRISRSLAVLAPLSSLALLAGCGGGGPTDNGGSNNSGPVASVQINASGDAMTVGQTRGLSVTLRNAQNVQLTGREVAWSVQPAQGVLTLSATSGTQVTATAVGAGSATVTASSEGKSAQHTITVNAAGPAPSQASVQLLAAAFNPQAVTIALNGTVTWTNNSGVGHTLEFNNPPSGVTNVSNFANGQEHSRTFGAAGTFSYICSIHSGMNGTVTVQP